MFNIKRGYCIPGRKSVRIQYGHAAAAAEISFGRDNLKNILVSISKFGMWVYIGNTTNATLQSQSHWWPLKGQILAIFSHFGPVLIYRKLDHPMAGIYNTYICPL